ncbi:YdcH family protein [Agarivorans sp. 1_MG-2023]|uniref:YdcH family protein n=1 Tax=unclassified Agarivorans TaxID=2636026 RepID=UPI0026E15819|nr:YdcH family protein [Agarivorans sp. 1_MG-2023]MDO6762986.1 YdcH family protein [Agarivorans sp. 1_MG-2023]
MLGEDHSLVNEFPEFLDTITALVKSDAGFAKDTKHYNTLDKEIRVLELQGGPIDDEAMHKLKHDRSVLKDALYQRLKSA